MKYYRLINDKSKLNQHTGPDIKIPNIFYEYSGKLVSHCSFIQNTIQSIIYSAHGDEIFKANKSLDKFPNPKSRIDFLCNYPYQNDDEIIMTVFNYAKSLFLDIYDYRNVLTHEIWASSDDYINEVMFFKLDEHAKILASQGKIWHIEETNPEEIYNSIINYIKKVKVSSLDNMHSALVDAELCSWILMQILLIFNEQEQSNKDELKKAFLIFKKTSHLFGDKAKPLDTVIFNNTLSKRITG